MAAALKLEEILYGPVGKERLRMLLLDMVSKEQNEATPPEQIQAVAAQALETINGLNRQLVELHDMILPPKADAMNQLAPSSPTAPPPSSRPPASARPIASLNSSPPNPQPAHAPRLCARGREFFDWLEAQRRHALAAIESVHVAAYIEQLRRRAPRRPRNCAWPRCGICSIGW